MTEHLEPHIQTIGLELLEKTRQEEETFVKSHHWEHVLLDWCMNNPELKTRVFRFIDVFPQLTSSRSVLKHIREYFPRQEQRLPKSIRAGLLLAHPDVLTRHPIELLTRILFERIAKMFIGASDEEEAMKVLDQFEMNGIRCSMDLLGERTLSEQEADQYFERYKRLIMTIGEKKLGLEKQNVSVKLSALDPQFDAIDPEQTSERVRKHLRELVRLAISQNVFIHIDMEEYALRDLTLSIVKDLLAEEEFKDGIPLGIVLQAYLKDAESCFESICSWAKKLAHPLTIRLVRGAYWDQEVMAAQANDWPVPVFTEKSETDWMFERLAERILKSDFLNLAVATHNVRSIAYCLALSKELDVPKERMEFQVLYGIGTPLMWALRHMDHFPRVYMPIGDPVWGMAYLVRRLLENVSAQSFVRRGIHEKNEAQTTLSPPRHESQKLRTYDVPKTESGGFQACPPLKFFDKIDRQLLRVSLDMSPAQLGETIPVAVNGQTRFDGEQFDILSPNDGTTLVAKTIKANMEDVEQAFVSAQEAFLDWSQQSFAHRAKCLRSAAKWMMHNRNDLAAIQINEVGKTYREADGDIKEAIDFLNFYADEALKFDQSQDSQSLPQERNRIAFQGRGVVVVIAPWNFPMAILTGMTAAALVTGNTVIFKPAEQSPLSGWRVFQAYQQAGIPKGVIHLINGFGEDIGSALVEDVRASMIAFTGSKEVGIQILQRANVGQNPLHVKKVIAEMGGKNAAIIDDTADFDQAIGSVLHSAFSFAGQKCSALSRLIVVESVYEQFMQRLIDAAKTFSVGDARDGQICCGPVIEAAAKKRIEETIEEGRRTGTILFQSDVPGTKGYYVPLTIIDNLPAESRLLNEEIFGPVLCVIKAKDFSEALTEANHSDFALTGGVFSRTPSHIELAKQQFNVGNLYINRSITGAIVGRHPFGGHKMSGTGTKAGGADYLKEFMLAKTVSENLFRHGFAPLDGNVYNKQ